MGFECVGEGAACSADLVTTWTACNYVDVSLCRICGDTTLTCYNSQCMRRTQGEGETCRNNNHLFCKYEFFCSDPNAGGVCINPITASTSNFAGFDDPCEQNSDCISGGLLYCDPYLRKCRLSGPEPYICAQEYDCPSGHYCSITDSTTTPQIPRQCEDALPLSGREGALCAKPESGAEQNSLECGYLFSCRQVNPLETDARFVRRVCMQPFSQGEGRFCAADVFCSSGKCWLNKCVEPDEGSVGAACRDNTDCGRFLICACPTEGGQRQRCIPDGTVRANDLNRQEYERQKGYLDCLESHGCQYIHAYLGTCGWNNCRSHLTGMTYSISGGNYQSNSGVYSITVSRALNVPLPKCEAGDSEYPDYEGYQGVIDSASSLNASFFLAVVLAFLALFGTM